jgi:DNA adenine methylase
MMSDSIDSNNGKRGTPKPFLKWVGGKSQLLPPLLKQVPASISSYHEPFCGGAALFFALARYNQLQAAKTFLSDNNKELIAAYEAIRDDVESVIQKLNCHKYNDEHYYNVREQDPWTLTPSERAARMIFLNKTGFNGLYRVNQKGKFNVPIGKYRNPCICDSENLLKVSKAINKTTFYAEQFHNVLDRAKPNDFVYFDPPYVPLSTTANFVSYTKSGFGLEEQQSLASVYKSLAERGVFVMLSNSDTKWVRKNYADFRQIKVKGSRRVNSKSDQRGPVNELIIVNYSSKGFL